MPFKPRFMPPSAQLYDVPTTAFGEASVAQATPMAGWSFAYNINADLVNTTLTGGGGASMANGMAVLSTSAATSSSATIQTKRSASYIPGMGGLARFTSIFSTPVEGSTQLIGIGDASNGFFFGYDGTQFGILRRRAGVDYWTYQDDWNVLELTTESSDSFILNPLRGNVWQIRFQWLGFGMITFSCEHPRTGSFIALHRIEYANQNTLTSIINPTLPLHASVANTTNDTDIKLYTPSGMVFIEGMVNNPAPQHPLSLTKTLAFAKTGITTEAAIVSIKNQASWQSLTNKVPVILKAMSVASDGNKNVTVNIYKNRTLGGSPSWNNVSANTSPAQYDTAGTIGTGGTFSFGVSMAKVDAKVIDLRPYGIVVYPGEIATITATSTASVDINGNVSWDEIF